MEGYDPEISELRSRQAWELANRQHGVLTRGQLLGLGFSPEAIKHRMRSGRLHPIVRGVYAVGRPRLFRLLAAEAGLPTPVTKQIVDEFEVNFYWPDLGLVVETDGWRYHRTAAAQTRDGLRFQTHTAAGLTPIRFSHWQVRTRPRDGRARKDGDEPPTQIVIVD